MFTGKKFCTKLHSETLMANGNYRSASKLLMFSTLLPVEGVVRAHILHAELFLTQALGKMEACSFGDAHKLVAGSLEWPENLSLGMPYPGEVYDRREDRLAFEAHRGLANEN